MAANFLKMQPGSGEDTGLGATSNPALLSLLLKFQLHCLPHRDMGALKYCLLQYLDLRDGSRPVHLQILQNNQYSAYTKEMTRNEGYMETCFAFPLLKGRNKQLEKKSTPQSFHFIEGVAEMI
jgi:hypothetical protein